MKLNNQKIREVLKTKTVNQSLVTLTGTFLNGAIGVIFYILVARELGPHDYGIFAFVTVTVSLVASISNIGTDTGVTKFVAANWVSNRARAFVFMKTGLLIKLSSWAIVFVLGTLLSSLIADKLLGKPELTIPIRISLIGVGGSMLFSFGSSSLQALERFWAWSSVNVFGNAIRLIGFLLLVWLGIKTADASVWLFVLAPFVAFILTLFMLPKFISARVKSDELSELFEFNKWVAITTVVVAIGSRIDTLFATRYLSLTEVGYYSVATSLAGFISQIVLALGSVAAPKFSSFKKKSQALRYFIKFELLVIFLSTIGIPSGVLLAKLFVPFVYGSEYIPSISPLIILIIAYSLFLVAMPVHTLILYFRGDSRFFFKLSLFHLAVSVLMGISFIPKYGINGAAASVLIGMAINLLIPAFYVYRLANKSK